MIYEKKEVFNKFEKTNVFLKFTFLFRFPLYFETLLIHLGVLAQLICE